VLRESQERAAEAGADGFIPKPCLPDELSRQVKKALEGSGGSRNGSAPRRPAARGRRQSAGKPRERRT
jgi:DNA-binding NarL/FixJ family response regulator